MQDLTDGCIPANVILATTKDLSVVEGITHLLDGSVCLDLSFYSIGKLSQGGCNKTGAYVVQRSNRSTCQIAEKLFRQTEELSRGHVL